MGTNRFLINVICDLFLAVHIDLIFASAFCLGCSWVNSGSERRAIVKATDVGMVWHIMRGEWKIHRWSRGFRTPSHLLLSLTMEPNSSKVIMQYTFRTILYYAADQIMAIVTANDEEYQEAPHEWTMVLQQHGIKVIVREHLSESMLPILFSISSTHF